MENSVSYAHWKHKMKKKRKLQMTTWWYCYISYVTQCYKSGSSFAVLDTVLNVKNYSETQLDNSTCIVYISRNVFVSSTFTALVATVTKMVLTSSLDNWISVSGSGAASPQQWWKVISSKGLNRIRTYMCHMGNLWGLHSFMSKLDSEKHRKWLISVNMPQGTSEEPLNIIFT